jgi:hypothetical protein
MSTLQITVDPGNIGRIAVIVHRGKCYIANVLDQIAGTTSPKRVRVQHDPFLQGTVLMPGEYEFKEWTESDD